MNRKVSITNPNEDRRVTKAEREALLEKLKQVEVSSDLQLIHALPREYTLDGQDGIHRPVGMWAKKIEMSGHLVFGAINSIQNLVEAVRQAGLATDDIVLEPLASSEACLDEQELKSGVILVDIGGGTTDVAMFVHGRLVHTAVLPVGGNHITRDISVGLKVPLADAEEHQARARPRRELPGRGHRDGQGVRSAFPALTEDAHRHLFQKIPLTHHRGAGRGDILAGDEAGARTAAISQVLLQGW